MDNAAGSVALDADGGVCRHGHGLAAQLHLVAGGVAVDILAGADAQVIAAVL